MTKDFQKYLLQVARKSIADELGMRVAEIDAPGDLPADELQLLKEKRGVFVTLEIDGKLRGCIGNIMPVWPLLDAVKRNAFAAAFEDSRFDSLSRLEFENLEIEISILSLPGKLQYKDADDLIAKLVPMRDGVILKKGYYEATYLPQVWEQIKDKETFLGSLCVKAGLDFDEWKSGRLEISIYTVTAFK